MAAHLDRSGPANESSLPRQIQPGIFWLHNCHGVPHRDTFYHQFISAFLILGESSALLVDTGHPNHWDQTDRQIDRILAGRRLDYLAPTHPEPPHAGNLRRLLMKHTTAQVIGDVRDYHLYLPEFANRLIDVRPDDSFDLGGGYAYSVLPAPVKDLASTVWGYEAKTRVMFVGDGFAYVHPNPLEGFPADAAQDLDVAVHRPGECDLFSEELATVPLDVDRAKWITRAALSWSRYVDATTMFREINDLLARHPTQMIAPAHGNVISNPSAVLPVIREAFELAYADR